MRLPFRPLLAVLTGRRRFEENLSEELRFHLDAYTADLIRDGVPPAEAARRARVEFGGRAAIEEECREARGLAPFETLARDLRYAARLLRNAPSFTLSALLLLAVCLGANLTLFAVLDAILLRPLPFPEPSRLVTMYNSYPLAAVPRDGASIPNYYERRGRLPGVESLSLYRAATVVVGEGAATERAEALEITPEFFTTLGAAPRAGRGFREEELTYAGSNVVILSDEFWRSRLQADPRALGRRLRLDGADRVIVGILPPSFRFLSSPARLYLPLATSPAAREPGSRHSGSGSELVARLRPGVSLAEVQAQVDAQDAALAPSYRQARLIADAGFHTVVAGLHADHVASVRPTLMLLQAAALFLLLLGAVNLANLLLIRAAARARERGLRLALGAGPGDLLRETLVETTLLTLLGGLGGLAVGAVAIRLLARFAAAHLPLGAQVSFDLRLAAAALVGALLLGLLLGLPIAALSLRGGLAGALQADSRTGTAGRGAQRLRQGLVVAQIAVAFLLLAGAGLLGASLRRAAAVSPGFDPGRLLSGRLALPYTRYRTGAAESAFAESLLAALSRLPGVASAAIATNIPLSGHDGRSAVSIENRPVPPGVTPRAHYVYRVAGDYFRTLGHTLVAGRFLTPADAGRPARVCVVDEDYAHYHFPGGGALGHRLFLGGLPGPASEGAEIVGIVAPVKQSALTENHAQGAVYFPFANHPNAQMYFVLRSALPVAVLGPAAEAAIRELDSELPAYDLRAMESRIADSLLVRRTPALLASLFAAVALLLAAIGTYGVLGYAVAQRRREIGVRMALGAAPSRIGVQFLLLALRLLALGTLLGLGGAWLAGRAMEGMLYGVPPLDPFTLAGAAAVLAAVSLAACLLPALRAARISPVEALSA